MKSLLQLFATLACAVALTACGGGSDYTGAVVIDPTTQPSGYSATDTVVGSGLVAANGDLVTMNYTVWLYKSTATGGKGTLIESSTSPLAFTVGVGSVIVGFDKGVLGMAVGGKRTLVVPANEAYGSVARGNIPANSGLVFDVELVSVAKK